MKRFFWALMLLLGFGTDAAAEWMLVAVTEDTGAGQTRVFVEADDVRRTRDSMLVWVLYDHTRVVRYQGQRVRSERTQLEIDCSDAKSRSLRYYSHSGPMGTGEPVLAIDEADKGWSNVPPRGPTAVVAKLVCAKR